MFCGMPQRYQDIDTSQISSYYGFYNSILRMQHVSASLESIRAQIADEQTQSIYFQLLYTNIFSIDLYYLLK